MSEREAGHSFLARLGKRRLRPGGKKATDWLLSHCDQNQRLRVLEVACNQGTTTKELARHFEVVGCDLSTKALETAKARVPAAEFVIADARALPFDDESFDVVINEAMLTMLSDKDKALAIKEYHRVLKPGGVLLTHDVLIVAGSKRAIRKDLSAVIQTPVYPLTLDEWLALFDGFASESMTGLMSLMNLPGMIRDEGWRTAVILKNAMKKENRKRFREMHAVFQKYKREMGFIAIYGKKG